MSQNIRQFESCWKSLIAFNSTNFADECPVYYGTVPHRQIARFVKIGKSATRYANGQMEFSPLPSLPWWVPSWCTTCVLQTVLIYHEKKHMNTLTSFHLFCYQCLAGKESPMGDTFSQKFSLKDCSPGNNVSNLLLFSVCIHDLLLILSQFLLSHAQIFRVQCSFPTYLSFQRCNSIETSCCWLIIHGGPLKEGKSM